MFYPIIVQYVHAGSKLLSIAWIRGVPDQLDGQPQVDEVGHK